MIIPRLLGLYNYRELFLLLNSKVHEDSDGEILYSIWVRRRKCLWETSRRKWVERIQLTLPFLSNFRPILFQSNNYRQTTSECLLYSIVYVEYLESHETLVVHGIRVDFRKWDIETTHKGLTRVPNFSRSQAVPLLILICTFTVSLYMRRERRLSILPFSKFCRRQWCSEWIFGWFSVTTIPRKTEEIEAKLE